eukprot:CAMPEP_0204559878 /NCGR_PEP_ID=MMETSP0661-20131031/32283_1 /ASSEMBLY_ACC=CAM_ASM_000606 /TAXON_ID=109239 /ORGANISM="Alexandrium margalefi, Strain AMGDE01CS-322" /LENGTH=49 /DNA_ID=CAMNT_0051567151 /DNA_START=193 /DNA_END=342 /DNA_ORIENTATION=-
MNGEVRVKAGVEGWLQGAESPPWPRARRGASGFYKRGAARSKCPQGRPA